MDEGASGGDFATMVPYLERTLDLSREYSSHFAPYKHLADPHIDDADEGMTTASTHKLFEELKTQLVPIVDAIREQPADDDGATTDLELTFNTDHSVGADHWRFDISYDFNQRFRSSAMELFV